MYGNKLRNIREEYEKTQEDMANILHISRGLYSMYETENETIPLKHLITICDTFNISVDYILGLSNMKCEYQLNEDIDRIESGKRLKEFRKNNNLTQAKLASILNVGQSTIAEYERGTNIIATPFLYELCKKYHISADYILGKTKKS